MTTRAAHINLSSPDGRSLLDRAGSGLPAAELALLESIDPARMPRHVAIIMDGNGRWARKQGYLDRIRGHEAGAESVRAATTTARQLGVEVLTLYAFSVENWQRPAHEIAALMTLLLRFLHSEEADMRTNRVRLILSGRLDDLAPDVRKSLEKVVRDTEKYDGLILNLALSYGGRTEILHSMRRIAEKVAMGDLKPDEITEETIANHLYQPTIPDPDLLIRTSGELRISNFLLWQIAYTELHVTPILWPEFRRRHFYEAVVDYQNRDRRFGKVNPI